MKMPLEEELRDESSETKIIPNPLPVCDPMEAQFELQEGLNLSKPRLAGDICILASPSFENRCTGRDTDCPIYLRKLGETKKYK